MFPDLSQQRSIFKHRWSNSTSIFHKHSLPFPPATDSSFFCHTEYRPRRDSSLSLTLSFHWSGHSALPASWIPLRTFFLFSITTDPAWVDPAWVKMSLLTTEKVCCLPQKVSPYLISISSWLLSTMLTSYWKSKSDQKPLLKNPSISGRFLQDKIKILIMVYKSLQ